MFKKTKSEELAKDAVDLIPAKNENMVATEEERRVSAETLKTLDIKRTAVTSWDDTILYTTEDESGEPKPVKVSELTPTDFFERVKNQKHTIVDPVLQTALDSAYSMLNKFKVTRQVDAAKKTIFYIETLQKERELVTRGIDTFVYVTDILEYIHHVEGKSICVCEVSRYERNIPDDICDKMLALDGIFDQYYVLFTDYTGKSRSKVKEERRDADPILFGAFQSPDATFLCDRWYYIGDWIDAQCDLTLAQMLSDIGNIGGMDKSTFTHSIKTPEDVEAFKEQLSKLKKDANGHYVMKE